MAVGDVIEASTQTLSGVLLYHSELPYESGAKDRYRAGDLNVFSVPLYQLSYFGIEMVVIAGFEPATSRLSSACSNPLSYMTMAERGGFEPPQVLP